jgi:GNAT superfamily N-acetyltransferase
VIDSNSIRLEVARSGDAEGLAEFLEHFDVAEFFVLPAHRGRGIGRQAATLLWDRLPGQWVVRVAQANVAALSFWRNAVQSYTGGRFSVSERPAMSGSWHLFSFRSTRNHRIQASQNAQ